MVFLLPSQESSTGRHTAGPSNGWLGLQGMEWGAYSQVSGALRARFGLLSVQVNVMTATSGQNHKKGWVVWDAVRVAASFKAQSPE